MIKRRSRISRISRKRSRPLKRSSKKIYLNNLKYENKLSSLNKVCFKTKDKYISPNNISMVMVDEKNNQPMCYLLVEPKENEIIIWNVCTNLKYRSQGCMSDLLDAMFKQFPRYKKFTLFVAKNNEAAIRLYQKMGFNLRKYKNEFKMTKILK